MSAPKAAETLAAVGHRIRNAFAALQADDRSLQHGDASQASIMNESQRFGLWAKNLGLYQDGHSSLDYRFRDAPTVYDYTIQLMGRLEESLMTIQDDLDYMESAGNTGAKRVSSSVRSAPQASYIDLVPETMQAAHEESSGDESSDEEESLLSYQVTSLFTIVLENLGLIIDTLYKLSFKIRNPATRLGLSKARTYRQMDEENGVDLMDVYSAYDLKHVAEITGQYLHVPCEDHFLVQRLARANTLRRRQFGQWRNHVVKLDRSNQAPAQVNATRPKAEPITVYSKENGVTSLPSTATRLEVSKINLEDSASVRTTSTSVTLPREDEKEADVHIQPLPEKLRTDNEFECPYCHILCAKRTADQSAWKRHVLRDLRPYVCTYEDCTEADQQYDSLGDWVSHEHNLHRHPKQQMQQSFELSSDPHGPIPYPNTPTLNDVWGEECPICLKYNPRIAHVALHLRKVAAFALPNLAEPDEGTPIEDQVSNVANIDDQGSMSSQKTSKKTDQDDVREDKIDDDLSEWNITRSRDVAPIKETRQENVQRFEHALQRANKPTNQRADSDNFVPEHGPDNPSLYSGRQNINSWAASVIRQPDSSDNVSISTGLTASVISSTGITATNVSFYARIEELEPNYQAQPPLHGQYTYWSPPTIKTGYTQRGSVLFRWHGGTMTHVLANNPIGHALHHTHSAATVFTQNPDTPHLLVVPFDARLRHAYQNADAFLNPGGWRPLVFRHVRIGNTQRAYSAVLANGDRQHIAAPGSPHWMPQLLPRIYDYQAESPRIQAGLVGSIPLLIALAAFSAPPAALVGVLTTCVRPMRWLPHQYKYPAGHIAERGMVVTIFFDPKNPQGSTPAMLSNLQDGMFGPFYS